MKKFEKQLFFYGIVCVTILFFSFGVWLPSALGVIIPITLSPVLAYFWLKLTSPETTKSDIWAGRFIFTVALLSFMGIFAMNLYKKNQLISVSVDKNSQEQKIKELETEVSLLKEQLAKTEDNEKIIKELGGIREELLGLKSQNEDQANAEMSKILDKLLVTPLGTVSLAENKKESVDVYAEQNSSSPTIGKIQQGQNYPYYKQEDGWIFVEIEVGERGWVETDQVLKVQN